MKKYFCKSLIMSAEEEKRFEQSNIFGFVVNYLRLVIIK